VAVTFRDADVLWLLFLVPAIGGLFVFGVWSRLRATERFGQPAAIAKLLRGRPGPWRATRAVLAVLGLAFLVIALAGPQYGARTRLLRKRGIDLVIALDFSKSMLAQDVRPSRIERAKAEIGRLIEELGGDRVGVVAFAGDALEFPMTTDYSAIGLFLRDLGPYDMPVGGTAIGRALVASKRMLDRTEQGTDESERPDRVVILFTDGEDHEGEPLRAADELATAEVRVYTVGIGSRTGEPIPTYSPDGTWAGYLRDENGQAVTTSLSEENEEQLRAIAERTHGEYFRAREGTVGVDAIRRQLGTLRQAELRARRITVHENRYALFLLPAFLLLLLETVLPESPLRRRAGSPSRQVPVSSRKERSR
jgi:Ca-activated chloride channel family protein